MKNNLLLLAFSLIFVGIAHAQTNIQVPEAVKSAFKAKFPNVASIEWEAEIEEVYEAEFKQNGKKMSAAFKSDGTWIETETSIKVKALPRAVRDAAAKTFPGYELEEANVVERPDQAVAYGVEMEKEEKSVDALFALDGKLLEQEGEETEEEGDGDGK